MIAVALILSITITTFCTNVTRSDKNKNTSENEIYMYHTISYTQNVSTACLLRGYSQTHQHNQIEVVPQRIQKSRRYAPSISLEHDKERTHVQSKPSRARTPPLPPPPSKKKKSGRFSVPVDREHRGWVPDNMRKNHVTGIDDHCRDNAP